MCLGDFNEILLAEKKQGWLDQPERQMKSFRDALDYCKFKDLGFNGFPSTWCNKRPNGHNVWFRLTRALQRCCTFLDPLKHKLFNLII